uniref:GLOBIN domain-containing protein n=1 Tax=Angiostrongylus cantonensis TaxID=6313 RepID=A0A158PA72_ANGCA
MGMKYKHVRPLWSFGLRIDDSDEKWKKTLLNDLPFRHSIKAIKSEASVFSLCQCYQLSTIASKKLILDFKRQCGSIQAAITMLMENIDDRDYMRKLLNEIGAHHFFYDATEPHLEHTFLESLRNLLVNDERMDVDTEQSWKLFLRDIKTFMGEGIAIQRNTYLRQFGFSQPKSFQAFAVTINSYSEIVGFCDLPASVKEFVVSCMVLEICPTFARKAMMEGKLDHFRMI